MKNLHLIPTDKPSRLHEYDLLSPLGLSKEPLQWRLGRNIYITSVEEIKEGDWIYNEYQKTIYKFCIGSGIGLCKKIILTTDQDLIKDGVQAIDDDFLEWFVKNPSCEEVEVKKFYGFAEDYLIIIPQEKVLLQSSIEGEVVWGETKITNICIKCGVDLHNTTEFICQEHPKYCKGIHISEETLLEWANNKGKNNR